MLKKLILCVSFLIAMNSICFAQKPTFAGNWVKWIDKNKQTEKRYSLTLKQKNGMVSGSGDAYSPKEVDLEMSTAKIVGNTATVRVKSDWGGTATVKMTLRGNKLYWKALHYKGELFFLIDTVFVRGK